MAKPIRRIALINFGGLGDGILFLPTIHAVAHTSPRAHITVITENRCQGLQDILPPGMSLLTVPVQNLSRPQLFLKLLGVLRSGKFDAVISSGSSPMISLLLFLSGIPHRIGFRNSWLSSLLLSKTAWLDSDCYAADMHMALARAYGLYVGHPIEDLTVIPQATLVSSDPHPALTQLVGSDPIIAIHPGVSLASIQKNILKAWPIEHWCAVVERIIVEMPRAKVVLLGGPDDEAVMHAINDRVMQWPVEAQQRVVNVAGETPTVSLLARALNQASVLICVDSAPMHLAVALGKPVVALFSPTDPKK